MTPTQETTASKDPSAYGEGFGVGLLPAEPGAAPGGELAADGEELGGEVRGGDFRTGEGRGDGGVPGPGGDVEDALARADAGRPDEIGAEAGDDLGGDRRVVARRPHGAVAGLELDVLVEHLLTHGEPPSVGCSQGPGGAGRPPVPRLYRRRYTICTGAAGGAGVYLYRWSGRRAMEVPRARIRSVLPGRQGDGDPGRAVDDARRARAAARQHPLQRAAPRAATHVSRAAVQAPAHARAGGDHRAVGVDGAPGLHPDDQGTGAVHGGRRARRAGRALDRRAR